jgi:hypothetical protein
MPAPAIDPQRLRYASGVTFVTLEDETGSANMVVLNKLACRQRRLLLGSCSLGDLVTASRDFC